MTRRTAPAAFVAALFFAPPAHAQLGDLFNRGADAVRRQVGADRTVSRTVTVEDVDLASLKSRLARFGFEIPVEADGRVTASLTVAFNLAKPTDSGSLRVAGSLSSPRLTLAPAAGGPAGAKPVVLTDLDADLLAADGVLTLQKLAFGLPGGEGKPTGRVRGSATFPYGDPGDATAKLIVKTLPLNLLWDRLAPESVRGGVGELTLDLAAPADALTDLTRWTGTATVKTAGVTAAGRPVEELRAELALKQGVAKLTELDAVVAGQPVGGAASVSLNAPNKFAARITSGRFDLAQLPALLPDGPALDGRGLLDLQFRTAGTLSPRSGTATGSVRGTELALGGVEIASIGADFAADIAPGSEALRLTNLTLATARGTLTGTALLDLAANAWKVDGGLADAPLAGVLEFLPECRRPPLWLVTRTGTVAARGSARGALEPFAVGAATGELDGENLELLRLPVSTATGAVRLDGNAVHFENVVLNALGGTVSGGVAVDFAAPDLATTGTADLRGADVSRLPPDLLPAGLSAAGPATGTVRFDFRFPIVEDVPEGVENTDLCLPRRGFRVASAGGEFDVDSPTLALPTGGELAFETASGRFEAVDDLLTVRDAELRLADAGGRVSGGGTLGLAKPYRFQTRVRWDDLGAATLAGAAGLTAPDLGDAAGVNDGAVSGTAAAAGTLDPLRFDTADGLFRANDLRLPKPGGGVLGVAAANAEFALDADALRLRSLDLRAAGGTVTGSATVARNAPRAFEADLTVNQFPLAELGGFIGEPGDFAGSADLRLNARGTLDGAGDRFDPRQLEAAAVSLEARDVRVPKPGGGTLEVAAADGTLALTPETLRVADLNVAAAGGTLTGSATVNRNAPRAFEADLTVNRFPLTELGGFVGEPGDFAGEVDLDVNARGTLGADGERFAPRQLETASGSILARDVRVPKPGGGTLEIAAADAAFDLDPDRLRVTELAVETGGGRLTGGGSVGRDAPRNFDARLAAEDFPLVTVGGLVGRPEDFGGEIDLRLDARGTLEPADVTGALSVAGADLTALGVRIDTLAAEADADGDAATVRRFTATLGGAAAAGAARVRFIDDRPWSAAVNLTGLNPDRLAARLAPLLPAGAAALPVDVRGTLAAALTAKGRVGTGAVSATLTATAPRLEIGLPGGATDAVPVTEMAADLTFARDPGGPGRVRLTKFSATLADGSLRATADVPLGELPAAEASVGGAGGAGKPPRASVEAVLERFSTGALLKAAFPQGLSAGGPAPVTGTANFAAAAEWPAGAFDLDRLAAQARLTAAELTLARAPAGRDGTGATGAALKNVDLTARFAGGEGRARFAVDALGGAVELNAAVARRTPLRAPRRSETDAPPDTDVSLAAWPVRVSGGAKLSDVRLEVAERLAAALGDIRLARLADRAGLRGSADAEVTFDSHPAPTAENRTPPRVAGRVRLSNLRAGDLTLTDAATANFALRDGNDWSVRPLTGRYGGGTFTAEAAALAPSGGGSAAGFGPGAARVKITLRDADAARALAPIPWLNENVTGRLSLAAEGVLGRTWRLTGRGALERGTFLGAFDFARWQLPAELIYDPADGSGRARLINTAAGVAGGTVRGNAEVTFNRGRGVGVNVNATVGGADAGRLLRGAGGGAASGRVAGTIELGGRRVSDLGDLTGAVRLALTGAQARSLPVVGQVIPFLQVPVSGGQKGSLDAVLRAGVVRVRRATLTGPNVRLFAAGTVAAASGRLNLEVVADTGRREVTEAVILRLIEDAAGPTPVGLALRTARLLRDRVVYLKVGGTISRPSVRVQAERQLREEAARFLLGELIGPLNPAGAAGAAAGAAAGG